MERLPLTAQEVRGGEDHGGDLVGKSRLRKKDSALGLDSQTFHHGGEEVNILAEIPEFVGGRPTGDIIVQYVARGTDDRPKTYEMRAHKTGEGQHTFDRPRRVFGF